MTSKYLFALPVILCLFLKIATKLAMALLQLLSVHMFAFHIIHIRIRENLVVMIC